MFKFLHHPKTHPSGSGLEIEMQHAVEYDHAATMSAALAANESIQAEARSVYGDQLTNQQCLDRVIAARWPNLREDLAYAAAADHYEVEVSA